MENELARRLALVAPESRAIVEKRIAVLERHLTLAKPSTADAERGASDLGMNVHSFWRLLRIWRASRDPQALGDVSGGRGRERGPRAHPGDAFVATTLGTLPAGRPLGRDVAAIRAAAAAAGVELRSPVSLRSMVGRLRAEAAPRDPKSPVGLFVDFVELDLVVEGPGAAVLPVASIVGDHANGAIHVISLGLEPAGPRAVAQALLHGVSSGRVLQEDSRSDVTGIDIDATFDPAWSVLFETLATHGVLRSGEEWNALPCGRMGGRLIHPRLLGIGARTRSATRPAIDRRPRRTRNLQHVMRVADAQAAIDERLAVLAAVEPLRLRPGLSTALEALLS